MTPEKKNECIAKLLKLLQEHDANDIDLLVLKIEKLYGKGQDARRG